MHLSELYILSVGLVGIVGGTLPVKAGELTFSGNSLRVLSEEPERNTGINRIFILYDIQGVSAEYATKSPGTLKVYKYSNLGAAYAEEITDIIRNDGAITIPKLDADCGYVFDDGERPEYFWIVNYLPHRFAVKSIYEAQNPGCESTILQFDGNASPIHYYTINGQQKTLNREISLHYDTQEWNEANNRYETVPATKIFPSITETITVIPPAYCDTYFTLQGDKFLKMWNWELKAESSVIPPVAVSVKAAAIQEGKEDTIKDGNTGGGNGSEEDGDNGAAGENDKNPVGSNQIKGDEDALGGSAPADIAFIGYYTEGVLHHEWQMSRDPEFDNIEYRFNESEVNHTFLEEGTFYWRYIGSNAHGTCESTSDVFTVKIGASELLCPNAFTPDDDGVNDEWKVSYRSLIDFKCWIFDRYGNQLHYFDNPDDGWDGKKGSKPVKSGVYYYVIQATGADGQTYKKSGDINILRKKNVNNSVEE